MQARHMKGACSWQACRMPGKPGKLLWVSSCYALVHTVLCTVRSLNHSHVTSIDE